MMPQQNAYILYLDVPRPLKIQVGALGNVFLPAGRYAYVGSARRGIEARILRHKRLAVQKAGKLHWHIDYLLTHPLITWMGEKALIGSSECEVTHRIASIGGVSAPVPDFGSNDCRAGCEAHLYRLGRRFDGFQF